MRLTSKSSISVLIPEHLGARNMSGELKQEEKLLEDVEKKDIWQGADLEIIQLVSSM